MVLVEQENPNDSAGCGRLLVFLLGACMILLGLKGAVTDLLIEGVWSSATVIALLFLLGMGSLFCFAACKLMTLRYWVCEQCDWPDLSMK